MLYLLRYDTCGFAKSAIQSLVGRNIDICVSVLVSYFGDTRMLLERIYWRSL